MNIGLRQLLLLVATIVFIVAIFINDTGWYNWASIGLACVAGALLVGEMGWDRSLGGPRRT